MSQSSNPSGPSIVKSRKVACRQMGQLGDTFHERRVALGITVDQAEEHTKIRKKLLDALEEGDYNRLPNPGYVRGYVSSYAKYLELDPVPLLAMYRAETGAGRFHDVNLPNETVAPRYEQHAVPWKAVMIVILAVTVISGGIWFYVRATSAPEALPPIPASPAGSQQSSAGPGAPATVAPAHVKVSVADKSASTLVITLDGAPFYKGTLTGGQAKEFDMTGSATLRIGRPSAVTVVQDGVKIALPPGTPANVELKVTPPPQ